MRLLTTYYHQILRQISHAAFLKLEKDFPLPSVTGDPSAVWHCRDTKLLVARSLSIPFHPLRSTPSLLYCLCKKGIWLWWVRSTSTFWFSFIIFRANYKFKVQTTSQGPNLHNTKTASLSAYLRTWPDQITKSNKQSRPQFTQYLQYHCVPVTLLITNIIPDSFQTQSPLTFFTTCHMTCQKTIRVCHCRAGVSSVTMTFSTVIKLS